MDCCNFRTYYAEIAHNVSTQKRKEIVEHVAQLYIVVTNKLARFLTVKMNDHWCGILDAFALDYSLCIRCSARLH
ncbi:hypothetical protein LOK49_LG06G01082 [Camellia lanceoleosa]|uniref:Uncharacterized protein n=1 Tax=Camellia lanceoleosa TaxID=1840588 RepID=A0ACC0H8S6_9ERIC|nr:hypothetical protein LOK49_LG06G01082 [Camellia lanceoleosa]